MEILFETAFNNALVPLAMDEFCANSTTLMEYVLLKLLGAKNTIFPRNFTKYMESPSKGTDLYFKRKGTVTFPNFSQDGIVKSYGGSAGQTNINYNLLSIVYKILFNLVWRALIPETEKRNEVRPLDMCYIFSLDHHIQINFHYLFIQHLTHYIKNHCVVGYGELINSLLSHFKVKTSDWTSLGIKQGNILNEKTLFGVDLSV